MINEENQMIFEMIAGIVAFNVLAQIILFFVGGNLVANSIGLWIGAAIGCGMLIHMKRSIEDTLDMGDEESATKYSRKMYGIRTAVVIIVLAALILLHIGNIIATLIGIIGLKVSAYLQPYMHRIFQRFENTK